MADGVLFGVRPPLDSDPVVAARTGSPSRDAVVAYAARLADLAQQHTSDALLVGRWRLGAADPAVFVAGDVPMLLAQHALPQVRLALQLAASEQSLGDVDVVGSAALAVSLAADVLLSPPFFLPTAALTVLHSDVDRTELAGLRLPFPVVSVLFACDVPLVLPDGVIDAGPAAEGPLAGVLWDRPLLADLSSGVFLTGVVLFSRPDGSLDEQVLFLVTSPPDESAPPPANLDRRRGVVFGSSAGSLLADLVFAAAAAVCWAVWRTPQPLTLQDGGDRRRVLRLGRVRRAEPYGALVSRLRVLDFDASARRSGSASRPGRTVRAHLRRGHWRRVRVGPRSEWRYRRVFIPPVMVAGAPAAPGPVVYRLPDVTDLPGEPPGV